MSKIRWAPTLKQKKARTQHAQSMLLTNHKQKLCKSKSQRQTWQAATQRDQGTKTQNPKQHAHQPSWHLLLCLGLLHLTNPHGFLLRRHGHGFFLSEDNDLTTRLAGDEAAANTSRSAGHGRHICGANSARPSHLRDDPTTRLPEAETWSSRHPRGVFSKARMLGSHQAVPWMRIRCGAPNDA